MREPDPRGVRRPLLPVPRTRPRHEPVRHGAFVGILLRIGFWGLWGIAKVVQPLIRRHERRMHERARVVLGGHIEGTALKVEVVDLSISGLGFETVVDVPVGAPLDLMTRIRDGRGMFHDVTVPLDVRSCRMHTNGMRRVGCRIKPMDATTRQLLAEFCEVAGASPTLRMPAEARLRVLPGSASA
jgi:hypothetical protein